MKNESTRAVLIREAIARKIEQAGIPRKQVAQAAGMDRKSLDAFLRGDRRLRAEVLLPIMTTLDIGFEKLSDNEDEIEKIKNLVPKRNAWRAPSAMTAHSFLVSLLSGILSASKRGLCMDPSFDQAEYEKNKRSEKAKKATFQLERLYEEECRRYKDRHMVMQSIIAEGQRMLLSTLSTTSEPRRAPSVARSRAMWWQGCVSVRRRDNMRIACRHSVDHSFHAALVLTPVPKHLGIQNAYHVCNRLYCTFHILGGLHEILGNPCNRIKRCDTQGIPSRR